MEPYLRAKRSVKCNMIEKLTFNIKIDLPGFDWSKEVGIDAVGASFGVKVVNYVELHLCASYFNLFKLNIRKNVIIVMLSIRQ